MSYRRTSAANTIVRGGLLAVLLAGLTAVLAAGRQDSYKLYKLDTPALSRTQAVAFTPGGSALALVQWRNIRSKPLSEWKSEYDLLVWDFRTGRVLVRRPLDVVTDWGSDYYVTPKVLSYFDGGKELVFCGSESIRILATPDYTQVAEIPVGRPPDPDGKRLQIDRCALSKDGGKIAVELRRFSGPPVVTLEDRSPIMIRVFDLRSRKETGRWTFPIDGQVQGFAFGPSGGEVAWTISSLDWPGYRVPDNVKNISLLNVGTGKLAGIHSTREEGEVAFASDDRLLSIASDAAFRDTAQEGIRIWDLRAGKMLGEIKSPPNGVHYRLEVSRNQRVILGYVGRDSSEESFVNVDRLSFRLWDSDSSQVLFTSPLFQPSSPRTPLPPQFTLDRDGHLVARWSPDTTWPDVYVYEVR